MRYLIAIVVGILATGAACTGTSTVSMSPTSTPTLAGIWVGSASDSTNSMMGTGMTTGMPGSGLESMAWHITQNGTAFSGTMQFSGHHGGVLTVFGHFDGHAGEFTMTIPEGAMPMYGPCGASASGTLQLDEHRHELHGTYTGANTCSGPFDRGHLSLTRP